ncbi:hypothetical protein L3081_22000 [Colwellia sp. MSW7]|uniref:Uncharacterized protein n=1 Tax=Colwellia maritima TaxID=2912588 RepID=A0ABS9X5R7_9GAMM|nr:hypothetical protein [Colwellia maritima]
MVNAVIPAIELVRSIPPASAAQAGAADSNSNTNDSNFFTMILLRLI